MSKHATSKVLLENISSMHYGGGEIAGQKMTDTKYNIRETANLLFWFSAVLLVVSVIPAISFGVWFGSENGPVELVQNLTLLFAFVVTVLFARNTEGQQRGLWILVSALLFIAFWRELSWGAALSALFQGPDGPALISSRNLWYRPAITPAIVLIVLASLFFFFRNKSWQLTTQLIQAKQLPVRELSLMVFAALFGTAAEGKMGMHLPISHDAGQNLEELAELCAYLFLTAAIFKIKAALDSKNIS